MRDYVHVADVATAAIELTRQSDGPRVVNVGSGTGHSILDVLDIVNQVTGLKLDVKHSPDRGFDVQQIILAVGVLSDLVAWNPVPLALGIERTWHDLLSQPELAMIG